MSHEQEQCRQATQRLLHLSLVENYNCQRFGTQVASSGQIEKVKKSKNGLLIYSAKIVM